MAELAANPIDGHFDFAHLQAIHRHLLGDLYEWAGEIRTIDTAPGDLGILHDPPAAIPGELDRVFTDINSGVYVNHHSHEAFVQDLAGHWEISPVSTRSSTETPAPKGFSSTNSHATSDGQSNGANSAPTPSKPPATSPTSTAEPSSPTSYDPRSNLSPKCPWTPSPPHPARTS